MNLGNHKQKSIRDTQKINGKNPHITNCQITMEERKWGRKEIYKYSQKTMNKGQYIPIKTTLNVNVLNAPMKKI